MENKRVATAVKTAVGMRNYQRARARALTRLANVFPTEYKQFLEEEKINRKHERQAYWLLLITSLYVIIHMSYYLWRTYVL